MSAAPKTYTQKFTVYRHDGDHLGNVKPGALLRYAQQIATTHAEAAGLTIRHTVGRVAVRGRARLAVCAVRRRAVGLFRRRFGGSVGRCGH